MRIEPKSVLVVAPHTDDMELCCGGTVARLRKRGIPVDCFVVSLASPGTDDVKYEAMAAAEYLGVTLLWDALYPVRRLHEYRQEILENLLCYRDNCYDLIIGPSPRDTHQDHETVAKEVFRAFKYTTILAWEAPWNNLTSELDLYVQLLSSEVEAKIHAISYYETQKNFHRAYLTPEYIRGWATMRGGQAGDLFAEAFEVVRMIT